MPFIGRDWRSPGEAWVKTESLGWQRMKIIESQLHLTCHQNHTNACSWPPRSQFGQHMEENCNKLLLSESPRPLSFVAETAANGADSGAGSSPSSSASTSPTGTPEKNNARHIRPITISSPYGRFSAPCCGHTSQTHDSNTSDSCPPHGLPATNHCNNDHHLHHNDSTNNNNNSNQAQATTATTSLSRETTGEPTTDCSSSTARSSSSSSSNGGGPRLLRYNRSVPDFRQNDDGENGRAASDNSAGSCEIESSRRDQATGSLVQAPQSPTPNVVVTSFDAASAPSPRLSSQTPQTSRSPSPSPPPSPTSQQHLNKLDTEQELATKLCACCCCCSTASGAVDSHHHLMMMELQQPKSAPHCQISVRTREVAMHNTISEAFYRLDFYNAIHDIRRFNYICKLLHLLITQNLTSLSGCATRVLFTMLEQVAWEVWSNKRNIHVIRNLLAELKQTIQKYYCWGRPIGSSLLWRQHFETIERIGQIVNGIELSPPKSVSYAVTFDKLPVEMVREILLRLDDYRDLVSSAQASPVMQTMIESQSIWQKLCRYHFTEQQLKMALADCNNSTLVKRNTTRGVKYARTTSADGRNSYRYPVAHKQVASSSSSSSSSSSPSSSPSSSSSSSAAAAADRASATRRQLEQTSGRRGSSNADRRSSTGATGGSGRPVPSTSASHVTNAIRIFDDKQRAMVRRSSDSKSSASCSPAATSAGRNIVGCGRRSLMELEATRAEIDWERVFHQLRKRFDLREEYADCLLLCRHCRCLFWKSFGHPCIRSDDVKQQPASAGGGSRPSVASLSRSFDRPSRSQPAGNNDENARLAAAGGGGGGGLRRGSGPLNQRPRQPLSGLNAQLRDRNANHQQPNGQASVRREELVPKHVTITPQAFLKFFSL